MRIIISIKRFKYSSGAPQWIFSGSSIKPSLFNEFVM